MIKRMRGNKGKRPGGGVYKNSATGQPWYAPAKKRKPVWYTENAEQLPPVVPLDDYKSHKRDAERLQQIRLMQVLHDEKCVQKQMAEPTRWSAIMRPQMEVENEKTS